MGKRTKATERGDEPMTAGRAVAIALDQVTPYRGLLQVAEATGVKHSTLRRLLKGQRTVQADTIARLRDWPGFSVVYDGLMGEAEPDAASTHIARRLGRTFSDEEREAIAFQLEDLAEFLTGSAIAEILKTHVRALRDGRQEEAGRKNSPSVAKK